MYVKAMFQEKVSGSWVNVESWEDSSNTITASGLEIYLVSRGTYRVTMTCSVNGEIKTATSAEKNYQFVEKCNVYCRWGIQTWIVSQRTPVLQTTPNMVNGMGLTPQHGVQYLLVGAQVKRAYQHPLFLSILPARQE